MELLTSNTDRLTAKLRSIKVCKIVDEYPDLSHLDQYENSTDKDEKKYYKKDQERKKAYNEDYWHMVGIRVEAKIGIGTEKSRTIQTISSAGLWGIESDSDKDYFTTVAIEEADELRDQLDALNIDLADFNDLLEEALTEAGFEPAKEA